MREVKLLWDDSEAVRNFHTCQNPVKIAIVHISILPFHLAVPCIITLNRKQRGLGGKKLLLICQTKDEKGYHAN